MEKILKHRYGIYYNVLMDSKKLTGSFDQTTINTFISPQGHYPWSHKLFPKSGIFGQNHYRIVGSNLIESISLPHPVTQCKDYSSERLFKSRDECIQVCIEKKQKYLDKKLPEILYFAPFNGSTFLLSNSTETFVLFYSECESKCPTGCEMIHLEYKYSGNDIDPRELAGYAKRHTYISSKIKFSLKFPLEDFIVYVAGIHGLWSRIIHLCCWIRSF